MRRLLGWSAATLINVMLLRVLPAVISTALIGSVPALADGPNLFAMDVTFALNAKGMCQGVDVVVDDLVAAAHKRNIDPVVIGQVRDTLLSTSGVTVPAQIGKAVIVAGKMIALDSESGAQPQKWCSAMIPMLKKEGLVRVH